METPVPDSLFKSTLPTSSSKRALFAEHLWTTDSVLLIHFINQMILRPLKNLKHINS